MDEQLTWTDLWADCTQQLGSSDEARAIVEQASGRSGASWLITLTTAAPSTAAERVAEMIARRLAGEPLQYVLGRWPFRQLNLRVDRRVLIPRPETEQVVEAAIEVLSTVTRPVVVDLGTGSGAIALSMALEVDDALVWATDVSAEALEVAEQNLLDLAPQAAQRVRFAPGSWFDALSDDWRERFDLVISNPPYVAESERADLDPQILDWEPPAALFSGPDGMDAITHLMTEAPRWLAPRGALVLEIAPHQALAVEQMAWDAGFFSVALGTDFVGRKRWLTATLGR